MKGLVLGFAILLVGVQGFGSGTTEPAYCDLKTINTLEVKELSNKLERLHVYKLGQVLVAGLAVGNSQASDVMKLATALSDTTASDGYCTWYINQGNTEAEKMFNWESMDKPTSDKAIGEYMTKLSPYFDTAKNNFLKCATEHRYFAMGCQGMKHRGPTFFGMMLAYSGCSAKSANNMVNTVWGTNGIDPALREAIMQKAYEYGQAHPDQSGLLQKLFTTSDQTAD